jgi:DNA-binding MarR family transcriptional regulator
MRREAMVAVRLSQLQKRILRWLAADHHRTHGVIVSSHEELVKALGGYKGNISRSLQTLESGGFIVIGRSPGGNAHHLRLTAEGHQKATEL